LKADSLRSRKKVIREAAVLLYSGAEKEYKQAKLRAAKTLGAHFLPSNLEVALELDTMAEENEGPSRLERLVRMRREALKIMRIVRAYNPLLVGSVWRGTIHRGSDIDIVVQHDEPAIILEMLRKNKLKILQSKWVAVTKKGKKEGSFHILLELSINEEVEIKITSPTEACERIKCEIYGDDVTGLRIQQLERLLDENPLKRFVPS
jgi:predicted nucleotidyltransferase